MPSKTPGRLPILDTSRVEEILDNDESLLLNILMEFNLVLLQDLESIERELNQEFEFSDIRSQAHKIKGNSMNLGATALADLSHKLEQASLKRSTSSVQKLRAPFSQIAKATLDELQHRLGS